MKTILSIKNMNELVVRELKRKHNLTVKQLEKKYIDQTVRGLAEELNIAPSTLHRYLDAVNIPLKGKVLYDRGAND